jgi:hypothetical protein
MIPQRALELFIANNEFVDLIEAGKVLQKELNKLESIHQYIGEIINRNNKYIDTTYKVTDLSTLVIHTEIKGQNEIIDKILSILKG